MNAVLYAHVLSTLGMFGVIWFVQLVHYPLFEKADRSSYPEFAQAHNHRTSLVVIPLMLTELGTLIWILVAPPPVIPTSHIIGATFLLAVIWASTFFLQVPMHTKLMGGFDEAAWKRLVRTNWVRTIAWSLKAVLVLTWPWAGA